MNSIRLGHPRGVDETVGGNEPVQAISRQEVGARTSPSPALLHLLGAPGQADCCHENPPALPCTRRPLGVRGLLLPARCDRAGGALVAALRPVLPRRRRAARRARRPGRHVTVCGRPGVVRDRRRGPWPAPWQPAAATATTRRHQVSSPHLPIVVNADWEPSRPPSSCHRMTDPGGRVLNSPMRPHVDQAGDLRVLVVVRQVAAPCRRDERVRHGWRDADYRAPAGSARVVTASRPARRRSRRRRRHTTRQRSAPPPCRA
jgi:hypothetical protein